ncbi:MAG TPA: MFS transporter [Fimbriimonadaceae bacterium]|nr:MFS transporter [Fimbriimonadaceae bacterium]
MSQPVDRLENLRTLRIANLDAAFATAFATLVSGTFLVGFVQLLGGSYVWIGVLTAVPSFLGLLQIPGAIWGRGFPRYKKFVAPGGFIWRLFYVPLIALPALPIPNEAKLWILLGCVIVASAATQFVAPIYNDWLAELVPTNSRGWFFSRRMMIATAVGAVGGFAGGLVLDAFRRADEEPTGFSTIFAIGIACAAFSMVLFRKMADTPRPNPIRTSLRESLGAFRIPLRDHRFRPVLVFLFLFVLGQLFAGNLYSAYALETLKMPFAILQATGISVAIGSLLTARMWGFLADKYGNKPLVGILGLGLVLTPAMWLITYPGADLWNAAVLILAHVFSGAVWSGVAICQFNLLLATADPDDRANYIGVGMALQALTGALAPMLGAAAMDLLKGPFTVEDAYKWVFGITMFLRAFSLFFLGRVREAGSTSVGGTLRQLARVSPKGYKALKQLSTSGDVATRESAIESVGSRQFGIASDEIVKALHDPSPRIRRQAARSLAKLGDAAFAGALIHQLDEHPDLVEEETIEALGSLGSLDAVGPLSRYLTSPRSSVRRAAAKALGQLGGAEAIEPLIEAAQRTGDPDLRRATLQALRALEAREAGEVIADALFDAHPSVRIAAAEAIVDLELRGAATNLRETLAWYDDEACSEMAYALGRVGTPEDAGLILVTAGKCVSIITRRRCLLGLARLLDVEAEAYRLLLLEGLSRDSALLDLLRTVVRTEPGVREALGEYSSGREAKALELLANRPPSDCDSALCIVFRAMAAQPVDEAFLVAACALAHKA